MPCIECGNEMILCNYTLHYSQYPFSLLSKPTVTTTPTSTERSLGLLEKAPCGLYQRLHLGASIKGFRLIITQFQSQEAPHFRIGYLQVTRKLAGRVDSAD